MKRIFLIHTYFKWSNILKTIYQSSIFPIFLPKSILVVSIIILKCLLSLFASIYFSDTLIYGRKISLIPFLYGCFSFLKYLQNLLKNIYNMTGDRNPAALFMFVFGFVLSLMYTTLPYWVSSQYNIQCI